MDNLPEPADCLTVTECEIIAELYERAGWIELHDSIMDDLAQIRAGATVH